MTFKFLAAALGGANIAIDKKTASATEKTLDGNNMNIS
jgi:hypothetical protein